MKVRFFKTAAGSEPVREWLRNLDQPAKKGIGDDIKTVQIGWPWGMPLVKSLGSGLLEVRSNLPGGRTARILFCMVNEEMIVLHGFFKKSQKTPKEDLALARQRQREVMNESKEQ